MKAHHRGQLYRRTAVSAWSLLRGRSTGAKLLYQYIRTGPPSSPIPGVAVVGRAGLAEELDWRPRELDAAVQELVKEGLLMVDWPARTVFAPRGPWEGQPDNPNTVTGYRPYFGLIPESPLKERIRLEVRASLESRGPEYVAAFDDACPVGAVNVGGNHPQNLGGNVGGKVDPNVVETGSGSGSGSGSGEGTGIGRGRGEGGARLHPAQKRSQAESEIVEACDQHRRKHYEGSPLSESDRRKLLDIIEQRPGDARFVPAAYANYLGRDRKDGHPMKWFVADIADTLAAVTNGRPPSSVDETFRDNLSWGVGK